MLERRCDPAVSEFSWLVLKARCQFVFDLRIEPCAKAFAVKGDGLAILVGNRDSVVGIDRVPALNA